MSFLRKKLGFGVTNVSSGLDRTTSGSGSDSTPDIESKGNTARATGAELLPHDEAEANAQLRKIKSKHEWDPNLPDELDEGIDEAIDGHNINSELRLVSEIVENSPYPEVRAAVRNVRIDWPPFGFMWWSNLTTLTV